jgi:ammonia channel protein AmtB
MKYNLLTIMLLLATTLVAVYPAIYIIIFNMSDKKYMKELKQFLEIQIQNQNQNQNPNIKEENYGFLKQYIYPKAFAITEIALISISILLVVKANKISENLISLVLCIAGLVLTILLMEYLFTFQKSESKFFNPPVNIAIAKLAVEGVSFGLLLFNMVKLSGFKYVDLKEFK